MHDTRPETFEVLPQMHIERDDQAFDLIILRECNVKDDRARRVKTI
jgi:hypothetical protein